MRVVNASFCCEALCDLYLRKVLYKYILLTFTDIISINIQIYFKSVCSHITFNTVKQNICCLTWLQCRPSGSRQPHRRMIYWVLISLQMLEAL